MQGAPYSNPLLPKFVHSIEKNASAPSRDASLPSPPPAWGSNREGPQVVCSLIQKILLLEESDRLWRECNFSLHRGHQRESHVGRLQGVGDAPPDLWPPVHQRRIFYIIKLNHSSFFYLLLNYEPIIASYLSSNTLTPQGSAKITATRAYPQ